MQAVNTISEDVFVTPKLWLVDRYREGKSLWFGKGSDLSLSFGDKKYLIDENPSNDFKKLLADNPSPELKKQILKYCADNNIEAFELGDGTYDVFIKSSPSSGAWPFAD